MPGIKCNVMVYMLRQASVITPNLLVSGKARSMCTACMQCIGKHTEHSLLLETSIVTENKLWLHTRLWSVGRSRSDRPSCPILEVTWPLTFTLHEVSVLVASEKQHGA